MRIYNTLSRKKEEFRPIYGNEARIYSCGPTVYDYAHIGNLRTYIFMDMLRRVLRYNGFRPVHVMNITDVGHLVSDADEGEDKMQKSSREKKMSPWEIAAYFSDKFFQDIAQVNVEKPEIIPCATAHIQEMIDFVRGLIDKGYGYEISDGIYFDISKFKDYGKLSGIDLDRQLAGARVELNEEKRHPADFALWKKASKEHIMQWPSPWGTGYPGWHIECSAMSRKYLGDIFDIHTGGVDHIPVHHENEIAQSEALLGKPSVRYWMHGEFLLVDGGKMSKSLGNVYTMDDLKSRGFDPMAFRYFCLNAHYRSKLNFTWDGLGAAQKSLERFRDGAWELKNAPDSLDALDSTDLADMTGSFRNEFNDAVNDDINIPKALGVAWNVIRSGMKSKRMYGLLVEFDSILGLGIEGYDPEDRKRNKPDTGDLESDPEIAQMVGLRQKARKDKDYKLADEIRLKLGQMGVSLEDTPQGVRLIRKE